MRSAACTVCRRRQPRDVKAVIVITYHCNYITIIVDYMIVAPRAPSAAGDSEATSGRQGTALVPRPEFGYRHYAAGAHAPRRGRRLRSRRGTALLPVPPSTCCPAATADGRGGEQPFCRLSRRSVPPTRRAETAAPF